MSVSSGRDHLGGATAAIFGSSRVDQDIRKSALDFAAEYTRLPVDHVTLAEKAGALEGDINRLAATEVISDALCQKLVNQLHQLIAE